MPRAKPTVLTMPDDQHKTPDEILATEIAEALVSNDLVATTKQDELSERIATGNISEEDWQVLIESVVLEADQGTVDEKTD